MSRRTGWAALLGFALLLAGCSSLPPTIDISQAATQTAAAIRSTPPATFTYTVPEIDALPRYDIHFELAIEAEDGGLSAQLIEDIQAEGRTIRQRLERSGALGTGTTQTIYYNHHTYIVDEDGCRKTEGDTKGLSFAGRGVASQWNLFGTPTFTLAGPGETINGEPTTRYRGALPGAVSTGHVELWVTDAGGQVVRWELHAGGDLTPLALEISRGRAAMRFELSLPDGPRSLPLPDACTPLLPTTRPPASG